MGMNATMLHTTPGTTAVSVQTVPARCLANYADTEAALWAEKLLAQAKSASGDAARFMKGM